MNSKARRAPKPPKDYQPIKLKAWLSYRNKTQEQLAEFLDISRVQVSRVANGKRPYTQAFLEGAAEYLETDPASLLMRDPTDPAAVWSIWDRILPAKREDALRVMEAFVEPQKKAGQK